MDKGDDVTINAKIMDVKGEILMVILKNGDLVEINKADVNTVRPSIKVSEIDHRKGN